MQILTFKKTFLLVYMANKKSSKVLGFFVCEKCDYKSSKEYDYNKHILTAKHKRLTFWTNQKVAEKADLIVCECGKEYKHYSSLSKHKKICEYVSYLHSSISSKMVDISGSEQNEIVADLPSIGLFDNNDNNNLIIQLIKENKELQRTIINQNSTFIEQQEVHNKTLADKINSIVPMMNTSTTTNTMNNNFNINLYLNEHCKDALNIMDFVKSLRIEMKDLELTGSHGFVEGMSNIIVKAMQNLDITKRPIHCTDSKKETLYVKDNEIWGKDGDKEKIKEAILHIKQNNVRKLAEWVIANPECENMDSPLNKMYMDMLNQTIVVNDKKINKIIKNVTKHVILDSDEK